MVGIQCKSCGHRALWTNDPAKFRPDYEVVALLTRSLPKCGNCGAREIHVVSGNLVTDEWLSDGPLSPASGPLIGGGKPGE
jgi:hypothetical protein